MEYHRDIPWPVTFSLLCQSHVLIKTDWTFLQYADNNTLYSQKRTKECRKLLIDNNLYLYLDKIKCIRGGPKRQLKTSTGPKQKLQASTELQIICKDNAIH